jgi:chromosome partitioning protein
MIYLSGGEKGGVGKSTIATTLAAMLSADGRDVLLLDTDTSGDASGWVAARRERFPKAPVVHGVQNHGRVAASVRDAARRYDDVVIDAGGRDSEALRSAMTVADLMVLPLCPSQFDLWSFARMARLVEEARAFNPALTAAVVLNRASTNWASRELDEARAFLEETGQLALATTALRDRKAYRTAVSEGLSVAELGRVARAAAEEAGALYAELVALAGKEARCELSKAT